MKKFIERRDSLISKMNDNSVCFILCAPELVRNRDVYYPYRQDSYFYYLTGFCEAKSLLVLEKRNNASLVTLFLQESSPKDEIWTGIRMGVEAAKEKLAIERTLAYTELSSHLSEMISGKDHIYIDVNDNHVELRDQVLREFKSLNSFARKGKTAPDQIINPKSFLDEMRLFKSEDEVEDMRRASEITAFAHKEAMRMASKCSYEYELRSYLESAFMFKGSERNAYSSIVASGSNATILHYEERHGEISEDDIILIDAGCEFNHYASDITRSFPKSGRFSHLQKDIYQLVLDSQKAAIEMVKPGLTLIEIHELVVKVLTQGLLDLKLLDGNIDECIEKKSYRKFYMHNTSHWIGMDVHDVGIYEFDSKPRKLEPGMVFTIEPGLYFNPYYSKEETAYDGIGIRIEDDILVTSDGYENLNDNMIKEISDIEALMSEGQ